MSYLVLARKWRPNVFGELVGQEHIARVLQNAVQSGKLAHAYIFSGPRGVGKTTTARILAKAVNCAEGPTATPCGRCEHCLSIASGSSVDVFEIDGASNNSVEDIRNLREQVKYAPSKGKYKIYIIDETHMLSTQAFNALLKTLEEPPAHVIFVLATTEPHKIPLTVHSRCQHLSFRRIPARMIIERLRAICDAEGIKITGTALDMLGRAVDGGMRDALTILDQLHSTYDEITESGVKDLAGATETAALLEASDALLSGRRKDIIKSISSMVDVGVDLRQFTKDLTRFLRDILVLKFTDSPEDLLDMTREDIASVKDNFKSVPHDVIAAMLSELVRVEPSIRASANPRIALEMGLLRISYLSSLISIKDAISEIETLEQKPRRSAPPASSEAESESPEETEAFLAPEGIDEEAAVYAAEPQTAKSAVKPADGEGLLAAMVRKIEDPRITTKLAMASPELDGEILALSYASSDSDICVSPLNQARSELEASASDIMGKKMKIEFRVLNKKTKSRSDIKADIKEEPALKDALDLFQGRIVGIDVKEGK